MAESLNTQEEGSLITSGEDIEVAVTCNICLRKFDGQYRRPHLLPECGHTFCRACVKLLACQGEVITCPSCRHTYKCMNPDNFPINFSIQVLASSSKNRPHMKEPAEAEGECSDHGVRFAFWCQSCEVAACGECLFDAHPRPAHTISRIEDVMKEVKTRAEELVKESSEEAKEFLGVALKRILHGISDMQEASSILQDIGRISQSAEDALSLQGVTKAFESAKGISLRVRCLNDGGDGGGGSSLHVGGPGVVALSDGGGVAQVKIEEKGIHIYSLRPSSTPYSVGIKMSVLLGSVQKVFPEVFLDLKAGERSLGRVYVTLWEGMQRSRQFIALCLGTLGPSYRGTGFDGVSERGKPGEYIRGGDYLGKKGLGGEALMDNLEWGGKWIKKIEAGQVCGVGGAEGKKFGSLFAICLQGDTNRVFRSPFGMVTSGLEVVEVAARHNPLSVVKVAECGVVVPL